MNTNANMQKARLAYVIMLDAFKEAGIHISTDIWVHESALDVTQAIELLSNFAPEYRVHVDTELLKDRQKTLVSLNEDRNELALDFNIVCSANNE